MCFCVLLIKPFSASTEITVLSGSGARSWRSSKAVTSGNARTVIQSVEGKDGLEAWKRVHHQHEPKVVINRGPVFAEFAAIITKAAHSIAETRDFITELDKKMKIIRELTHGIDTTRTLDQF